MRYYPKRHSHEDILSERRENVKQSIHTSLGRSLAAGYNPFMLELDKHGHLPSMERLSVLVATILMAYIVGHQLVLPAREISLQLPGLYLVIRLNAYTFVTLIVAGMTATGVNWLLRDHPYLGKHNTLEHWLLPALTALVIGIPLFQAPFSAWWWAGFVLFGTLLILVLVAEYITIDPEDARHPLAAAGLTVVSFALYLVLASALRFSGVRLFLLLPSLALGGGLVSLRALRLRIPGQWSFVPAGVVTLITIQIAAALHYWPVSPVRFGLLLLGPAYCLTNLVGNLAEGEPFRQAMIEPAVVLALIWGAAFIIG